MSFNTHTHHYTMSAHHARLDSIIASSSSSDGGILQVPKKVPNFSPRTNVISGDEYKAAVQTTVGFIAETVSRTLGPHGSTTLIRSNSCDHIATKDGFTVLQYMSMFQETSSLVLDEMRALSRKVAREVGDGSTTAVTLAAHIYGALEQADELQKYPPRFAQVAISATTEQLVKRISQARRVVSNDKSPDFIREIETVAAISANNDFRIGQFVAEAFQKYGAKTNVTVELGHGEKSYWKEASGYTLMRGLADDCFATESTTESASRTVARLGKSAVSFSTEHITQQYFEQEIAPLLNAAIQQGLGYVLVAPGYDNSVIAAVRKFIEEGKGAVRMAFVDHSVKTRRGSQRLADLVHRLPDSKWPRKTQSPVTCFASSFFANMSESRFFTDELETDAESERILRDYIEKIRTERDTIEAAAVQSEETADIVADLTERIAALEGSEIRIVAGGNSALERSVEFYALEDAAMAVKSACTDGYVEGLGLTAIRALNRSAEWKSAVRDEIAKTLRCDQNTAKALSDIACDVLSAAYENNAIAVIKNGIGYAQAEEIIEQCVNTGTAYNALTMSFYDPTVCVQTPNPVQTDIKVLRAAASTALFLFTSTQMLLTNIVVGSGMD